MTVYDVIVVGEVCLTIAVVVLISGFVTETVASRICECCENWFKAGAPFPFHVTVVNGTTQPKQSSATCCSPKNPSKGP